MSRCSPDLRFRRFLTILLITYNTRGGGLVFAPASQGSSGGAAQPTESAKHSGRFGEDGM
jgi:hypothetical protein